MNHKSLWSSEKKKRNYFLLKKLRFFLSQKKKVFKKTLYRSQVQKKRSLFCFIYIIKSSSILLINKTFTKHKINSRATAIRSLLLKKDLNKKIKFAKTNVQYLIRLLL